MNKFLKIIFSIKTTIILMLLLAIALGIATFIEDKYDTLTAKMLVYNAKWFEVLLVLLVINFIGNIKRYNLFSKKRAAILLFHLAFILLIVGSAITRYIGFEGTMHIREGESSDVIFSSEPYLRIINGDYNFDKPIYLNALTDNKFNIKVDDKKNGEINISFNRFIKNSIEKIEENVQGGKNIIELTIAGQNGKESVLIKSGEVEYINKLPIAYNNNAVISAIKLTEKDGIITINSPYDIAKTQMMGTATDTILKNTDSEFQLKNVYKINSTFFLFSKFYKNAIKKLVPGGENDRGIDALVVDVTNKGKKEEVALLGGTGYVAVFQDVKFNGLNLKLAYGEKPIQLPFSVFLNDFILERYPGSMSPSSYASEVTLVDKRYNLSVEHRIFMNHVMDYDKFRFFQSSYDMDEKGTILSVNHDFYGTWITYLGYFLLGVGFVITLLRKHSRFYALRQHIKEIRKIRKETAMTFVFLLGLSTLAFSQNEIKKPIDAKHAEKFGHLIVQTFDGRFEPVHTLAYDVMHKVSRKDNFDTEGKGNMDGMQIFMDMFLDAEYWKAQKIILVREKSIQEAIGITGKYASFNDFFTNQSKYKLSEFLENAFRKKPAEQNTFDKGIIKVDERVNICMDAFKGSLMRIFPHQAMLNNKFIAWNDSSARMPLRGSINIINEELKLRDFNYTNIYRIYFIELFSAVKSGDYSKPDKILGYMNTIQRQGNLAEILPSESKINMEIYYNNAQIFIKLRTWYAILSLVLLVLAFIDNLRLKKSKIISITLNIFIGLLGVAFLYHTWGMGLRWYLTEHAPWSNGYEALILVAWGGLIAGFSFVRYSKITLAATAVLAFSILMTASHSSYDPQLTNLQPVLKSYWLIIHVAVITISYGFLALGFILGLMNMFIYLFKTNKNAVRLNLMIKELTYINEMNLSIGLVLATLGTFLGGIWANESWGRYWGWDAKETWALVIVITYAVILHLRLIPKLKGIFSFNVASIVGFASVIMTFVGVNYFLSKGMHSYAGADTPVFPIWAWIMILSLLVLIIVAGVKEAMSQKEKKIGN